MVCAVSASSTMATSALDSVGAVASALDSRSIALAGSSCCLTFTATSYCHFCLTVASFRAGCVALVLLPCQCLL